MSHADSSYSKNNLTNNYLLTFLGSVLGEAIDDSISVAFEDTDAPDKSGVWPVMVYKEHVCIIDDGNALTFEKMYLIIGYCTFHNIDFVINGQLEEKFWRKSWQL